MIVITGILLQAITGRKDPQSPSVSLRKSDNSNGGYPYYSIVVTGIVVVISLTTQAAALITH